MSRQAELQEVIRQLRQAVPEITGVMMASTDGLCYQKRARKCARFFSCPDGS
jgi:predicted regulator of Ras-like GTPase activity (Roadblock/LC7/MglB family)